MTSVKPVLMISGRDNVATALEPLVPGREIDVNGRAVIVREPIPSGHKVAVRPIPAGEVVIKYGSPIGTATAPIAPGDHVHVHNVASARGRGDLG
jgi:altronate hydrolase